MAKKAELIMYTEEQFKQAVRQAGELNRAIKDETAKLKDLKPSIINYMMKNDLKTIEDGPYRASYIIANSSKMDEEKVIQYLEKKVRQTRKPEKKELIQSAIKVVKQVDEDVLEQLVYDGIISASDLEPMTTTVQSNKIRLDYKK